MSARTSAVDVSDGEVIDTDVLIIGAGPAGLFACYYAGLRKLSVVVLDTQREAGGQLMALYPEKPIFDVAGLPRVTGAELTDSLVVQAQSADPRWVLGERAVTLLRDEETSRPIVVTDTGRRIRAGGVVVAAGIGSFQPRRLPAAEGHLGRGMHYTVRRPDSFADLDVVVVGGGDSAVDWANLLHPVARSVTLVHRRRRLRAYASSIEELRASPVRVLLESEVVEAHGSPGLEHVVVRTGAVDEPERLPAQALIAALGHTADLGSLAQWGFDLHTRQITVDQRMRTGVPDVFAAGDVTTHPGKVRIMAVGFGEAATAVNNLAAGLRPDEGVFPGHSTELAGRELAPAGATR